MSFRRRGRAEVSVNLTPLIDVVFLLLIFFMVSTTFSRETQLAIDLPEASGSEKEQPRELIEVLISEAGDYRVNGRVVADQELRSLQAAIYAVSQGDTLRPLMISADAEASHRSVVRALDAVGQMGFSRLTINTVEPAG